MEQAKQAGHFFFICNDYNLVIWQLFCQNSNCVYASHIQYSAEFCKTNKQTNRPPKHPQLINNGYKATETSLLGTVEVHPGQNYSVLFKWNITNLGK